MRRHARCPSCRIRLPPDAVRCWSCGHTLDDRFTVEPVRTDPSEQKHPGRLRTPRAQAIVLASVVALMVGVLATIDRLDEADDDETQEGATVSTSPTTELHMQTTAAPSTLADGPVLGERNGFSVVLAHANGLSLLDLDTGELHTERSVRTGQLLAVAGGFVVARDEPSAFVAMPYRGKRTELRIASTQALPGTARDRVWLVNSRGAGREIVEFNVGDGSRERVLSLPAGDLVGSTTTGLVVQRYDGIFLVLPDGTSRHLATGQAVAVSRQTLAYASCTTLTRCPLHLRELASGAEREVDLPKGRRVGSRSAAGPGVWGGGVRSAFSPDGKRLLVVLDGSERGYDWKPALAVVDVATSDVAEIPSEVSAWRRPIVWSPDGRYLFWLHSSGMAAYRLGDEAPRTISLDLPGRAPRGELGRLDIQDAHDLVVVRTTGPQ